MIKYFIESSHSRRLDDWILLMITALSGKGKIMKRKDQNFMQDTGYMPQGGYPQGSYPAGGTGYQGYPSQQGQQALLDAQQEKLDKLVGVRTEIIEELMEALKKSNITGANVDDSGAIVFSSEMMFSTGSAGLNETGKRFLNRFLPNYLKVLMSEEYSKNVSQIIIEGHTDTSGSYMTNVELSQDRALSVLKYVMSSEFTGISNAEKRRLEQVVTINGRAYSDPIYKADGTIDMSASRRVVIKFRLNDEDMVTEMLNVLNDMN